MKKTKLAIIFDTFLISIITLFLCFLWLNKLTKNAFFAFFVGNIVAIIIFIVVFKKNLKKFNITNLKNKELKFAQNCFSFLTYCSTNESITFFEKLLNSKNISQNIYENNENYFYVNLKSELTNIEFFKANEFYLSQKNKQLNFIAIEYDESFTKSLSDSPIKYSTYTSLELFNLMKEKNVFPIEETKTSHSFSLKTKNTFSKFFNHLTKNNFKNFFFSGISLLLISAFIPYSIYYLIMGSLLLFFSIICIFRKNKVFKIKEKPPLTNLTKK